MCCISCPRPAGCRPTWRSRPTITGLITVDSILHWRWDVFGEALRYLLLPSIALAAATMGQIARITRASMIDVSSQDYIEARPRLRRAGPAARVQIYAAPSLRAAADHLSASNSPR